MEPPCPNESTTTPGHREPKAERTKRLNRLAAARYRQKHRQRVRQRNREWFRNHRSRANHKKRESRERLARAQQAADERRSHRTHRTPAEAARLDLIKRTAVVSLAQLRRPTFILVHPDGRRTKETLDAPAAEPRSTTPPKAAT